MPVVARTESDASGLVALQSQIRDLAAMLALAAMWRGREVPFIASSLLDALVSLLRLDLAYLWLENPGGGAAVEECRPLTNRPATEIGAVLEAGRSQADGDAATLANPLGTGPMRVVRFQPRLDRERGVIIVCSRRADFPTDVESFLLRTGVEQGMVALQASRLLRDLQEANTAKSAFLATMSHELRTPLNAILGYVDLLDAGVGGNLNEQQKKNLGRVRAGSRHLLELIEGVLSFARIDAGKEEVHLSVLDLCELVSDTAALAEPLARVKGLDLIVHTPEGPLMVETDASKVRQILLNLLSNAVKFTTTGYVQLDLECVNDTVELVVSDSGIGIPASELENIFEPFRQVGNIYTGKAAGTGLGLSVSRQLVRLLGGVISVDSVTDKGSFFRVSLPYTPVPTV